MENSTPHTNTTHSKKENGFNPAIFVWGLAGLLILAAGYLAIKAILAPFNEHKLILVDVPKEAFMGSVATFTWRIDGSPTTTTTTSVRLGAKSNPGELSKETKPGDTSYTETLPDFANGEINIPLQFVGNMKMPPAAANTPLSTKISACREGALIPRLIAAWSCCTTARMRRPTAVEWKRYANPKRITRVKAMSTNCSLLTLPPKTSMVSFMPGRMLRGRSWNRSRMSPSRIMLSAMVVTSGRKRWCL